MKRKLACFLAAVMTITALPLNVLAAPTDNFAFSSGRTAEVRLTKPVISTNHTTTFVEWGSDFTGETQRGGNWVEASDLAIVFDEGVVSTGRAVQFTVELDNADWFFSNSETINNVAGATYDQSRGSWNGGGGNQPGTYTRYADPLASGLLTAASGYTATDPAFWTQMVAQGWIAPIYPNTPADIAAAFLGTTNYHGVDTTGLFTRTQPLYTLEVSRGNPRLATVTLAPNVHLETNEVNPGPDTLHRGLSVYNEGNMTNNGSTGTRFDSGIEAPMADLPQWNGGISTGDTMVPMPRQEIDRGDINVVEPVDAVETFGKKQKEQAPEGETAPTEQPSQKELPKPAKTAEAVMVDAMDSFDDYARSNGANIRDGYENGGAGNGNGGYENGGTGNGGTGNGGTGNGGTGNGGTGNGGTGNENGNGIAAIRSIISTLIANIRSIENSVVNGDITLLPGNVGNGNGNGGTGNGNGGYENGGTGNGDPNTDGTDTDGETLGYIAPDFDSSYGAGTVDPQPASVEASIMGATARTIPAVDFLTALASVAGPELYEIYRGTATAPYDAGLFQILVDALEAEGYSVVLNTNVAGNPDGTRAERIQNYVFCAFHALVRANFIAEGITSAAPAVIQEPQLSQIIAELETAAGCLEGLFALFALPTTGPGIYIDRNAGITIPLVTRSTSNNADLTVRVTQSTPIPISSNTLVYARTAGGTTTTVRDIRTARERIDLFQLTVRENRPGVFPDTITDQVFERPDLAPTVPGRSVRWAFELVAPAGYRFANPVTSNDGGEVKVVSEGGIRDLNYGVVRFVPNSDNRVVAVGYEGLTPSTALTGALVIEGLALVSNNPDNVRDQDLNLEIRRLHHGGVEITEQSILVARARDFAVTLTAPEDVPTLINGRLETVFDHDVRDADHRAARVRLNEVISNSLWNNRDIVLELPQEVRVRKVAFRNINGIANGNDVLRNSGWFYNDRGRETDTLFGRPGTGNTPEVRINDNVITLRNIDRNGRIYFDIDLWLNIEAGFTGDVELTLRGSALSNDIEEQSVVVAKAINPIEVNANLQNVRMGYTFAPVGNFTITENVAGALQLNEELFVSVTDEFFSEIHIGANFRADVTDGDLRIRNVRASNNLGIFNNWNQGMNWRLGTNAILEIDRESTKPSTIEFSNVALRLSPISPIPQGQHTYSIVAWGPAVAANFEGVRDASNPRINSNEFFNTPGISRAFVQALGAGASGFTNVVRVTVNSPIITMAGEQMLMDTAAYISPTSESLMVPVRFVAMALGLEPGRVLWNAETNTVTVDAGENRIVQFTTGSSTMRINGIEIPMLNALGHQVYTEIRDERAFIPFRALADALNVYVSWDPATATATFDPNRAAERNFHLEDLIGNAPQAYGAPSVSVVNGAATVTANRVAGSVRTAS